MSDPSGSLGVPYRKIQPWFRERVFSDPSDPSDLTLTLLLGNVSFPFLRRADSGCSYIISLGEIAYISGIC